MGGLRTYNIVKSVYGSNLYDVDFGGHIRKVDPAVIRRSGYYDGHTRVDIHYNRDRGIYEAKIDGEFPNFKPAFNSKSDVASYIKKKHSEGVSYQKIADYLNKKEVSSPSGKGKWHGSSVGRILKKGGFNTDNLYDSGSYPSTVSRIHDLKNQGCSHRTIAKTLNTEGVKTLSGRGQWYGASIGRLLKRHPMPERQIQTQTEKVKSVMQSINNEQELQERLSLLRDQKEQILKDPDKALHDDVRKIARAKREESSGQPQPAFDEQARINFLREQARKLLGK